MSTGPASDAATAPETSLTAGATRPSKSLATRLRFGSLSGLYGLAVLIVVFGVAEPDLFLTETNLKVILINSAITGTLACGMLVPVLAGQLDLSFGSVAGFAAVFFTWLTQRSDINTFVLAAIAVLVAAVFGVVSGLLVSLFDLNSLIVTLGMSSVAAGTMKIITKGNTMPAELDPAFSDMGIESIGPIPILVLIMLFVATVVYIWLEHTPNGRFILATGNNANAARLAGVNVPRIQVITLTFSAAVAGLVGVLIVARVGTATDTSAAGYLLPVIAAVFLGSTQVMHRPNVVGTLIAIYLLGTGVQGFQLRGSMPWVNEMFNGAVLLVAIAIATVRRRPPKPLPGGPTPSSDDSATTTHPSPQPQHSPATS